LYPREHGGEAGAATADARARLAAHGCSVAVSERSPEGPRTGDLSGVDLVLALGGDGTLLRASRLVGDAEIPICGVNLGDLGFLSAFRREELGRAIDDAVAGRLPVEPRMRMRVDVWRRGELLASDTASNDCYVKHGRVPRLLRLATYIGEFPIATYRADGLIVCTPLGSTAYNLAAGGPIIEPGTGAFTVTPICPHSLSFRPVVTPADGEIRIVHAGPAGASSAFLTCDGQWTLELEVGDEVRVRRAEHPFQLVPPHPNVFQVLAAKLGWHEGGPGEGQG
jgi:NAD+ kinase